MVTKPDEHHDAYPHCEPHAGETAPDQPKDSRGERGFQKRNAGGPAQLVGEPHLQLAQPLVVEPGAVLGEGIGIDRRQ